MIKKLNYELRSLSSRIAGYLYLEINLIVLITRRKYLDEGLRSCKETGCYERNKN